MGKLNPSKEGARALGDFLDEVMNDLGLKQAGLVSRLAEVGYQTNVPKIQRLRTAAGEPDAFLVRALARLQILCDREGTPYSLDDLMDIVCGQMKPGDLSQGSFKGGALPYAEAIAEIRKGMKGKSEEEFAAEAEIPLPRLRQILRGEVPNFLEFVHLSAVLYEDKRADHLAELYGFNLEEAIKTRSAKSGRRARSDRPSAPVER